MFYAVFYRMNARNKTIDARPDVEYWRGAR